jgi:hypothetical protein
MLLWYATLILFLKESFEEQGVSAEGYATFGPRKPLALQERKNSSFSSGWLIVQPVLFSSILEP